MFYRLMNAECRFKTELFHDFICQQQETNFCFQTVRLYTNIALINLIKTHREAQGISSPLRPQQTILHKLQNFIIHRFIL